MKECQYCFMMHEGEICESVTCRRHREYWGNRSREQDRWFLGGSPADSVLTTCVLHVGFVFIEETEEMIEALKKKDESEKHDGDSSSRLSQSNYLLQPIDKTAARVAQAIKLLRLPAP